MIFNKLNLSPQAEFSVTVNGEWSLPGLTWTDEPYIILYLYYIVLYLLYYLIVFIILFHYIYYIISLYLLLLLWYYIYLILLYYLHLTLYYLHLIQLRMGRIGQLLWALVSSQAVAEAVLFKLLYEKKNLSIKATLSAAENETVYWFVSFPQILLSSAIHHSAAFSPKAIDLSMAWEAEGCWAEWLLWWNQELWGNIQLVKHIIDLLSSEDLSLPVDPQLRQHLLFKVQPLFCHPKRFWSTEICVCAQVHIPRTFFHSLIHMKKKRKGSFLFSIWGSSVGETESYTPLPPTVNWFSLWNEVTQKLSRADLLCFTALLYL